MNLFRICSCVSTATAVFVALCALSRAANAQSCGQWVPGDGVPGVAYYSLPSGLTTAPQPIVIRERPQSTVWDPDGDGPASSLLIVCGRFVAAGQTKSLGGLIAWNGLEWVDPGVTRPPLGAKFVATFRGRLIAASQTRVAEWTGSSWNVLAELSDLRTYGSDRIGVQMLAVLDDTLYVGGGFRSHGGQPCTGLIAWNGQSWSSSAVDTTWVPLTMARSPDGSLVLGGFRYREGTSSIGFASELQSGAWVSMDAGLQGFVFSLTTHENALYAAWGPGAGSSYGDTGLWAFGTWVSLGLYSSQHNGLVSDPEGLLVVGSSYIPVNGPGPRPIAGVFRYRNAGWGVLGDSGLGVASHASRFGDQLLTIGSGTVQSRVVSAAVWEDGVWRPTADGVGHTVSCIAEWNGRAVAAGGSSVSVQSDSGWRLLAANLYGVHGLVAVGRQLFIAYNGENQPARLAVFDDQGGRFVPSPMPALARITDMVAFNNALVVATRTGQLMQWDGGAWEQMAPFPPSFEGLSGVNVLYLYNGELLVGCSNTDPTHTLIGWDGQTWRSMGERFPSGVYAVKGVCEFEGRLHADLEGWGGGLFRLEDEAWVRVVGNEFNTHSYAGQLVAYRNQLFRQGAEQLHGNRWIPLVVSTFGIESNTIEVVNDQLCIGRSRPAVLDDGAFVGYLCRWVSGGPTPTFTQSDTRSFSARGRGTATFVVGECSDDLVSATLIRDGTPFNTMSRTVIPQGRAQARAATVQIALAGPEGAGEYRIEAWSRCGTFLSEPFNLEIRCAADFDGDHAVTVVDLLNYLDAWYARTPDAEHGTSYTNNVTIQDLLNFITDYITGCP